MRKIENIECGKKLKTKNNNNYSIMIMKILIVIIMLKNYAQQKVLMVMKKVQFKDPEEERKKSFMGVKN